VEMQKGYIIPYGVKYKRMLDRVRKETGMKDIFKIVEEAQRRLRRNERKK
jgi:hypothetical protein